MVYTHTPNMRRVEIPPGKDISDIRSTKRESVNHVSDTLDGHIFI